jgi:hypothetical protein
MWECFLVVAIQLQLGEDKRFNPESALLSRFHLINHIKKVFYFVLSH